jgi:hypothetical protein
MFQIFFREKRETNTIYNIKIKIQDLNQIGLLSISICTSIVFNILYRQNLYMLLFWSDNK